MSLWPIYKECCFKSFDGQPRATVLRLGRRRLLIRAIRGSESASQSADFEYRCHQHCLTRRSRMLRVKRCRWHLFSSKSELWEAKAPPNSGRHLGRVGGGGSLEDVDHKDRPWPPEVRSPEFPPEKGRSKLGVRRVPAFPARIRPRSRQIPRAGPPTSPLGAPRMCASFRRSRWPAAR